MATKGKTPASRSLNYSLGGDILNRVKGSLDSGSTIKTIDEGLSGITDTIGKASQNIQEERLGQVKEKARKKEEANAVFDAGLDAFGSRASWSSGPTYDKFMEIEKAERAKYEQAVADGNTELANKILREQKSRMGQQQAWKGSFDALKTLQDNDGILTDLDSEDAYIIGRIASQEGDDFKVEYTDKGETVMTFNSNDNPPKKISVRGADFDKIVARNTRPTEQAKKIAEELESYRDDKRKLISFNPEKAMLNFKGMITKNNINAMMRGELGIKGTGSFLSSFDKHPDFNRISQSDLTLKHEGTSLKNADTNKDGVISGDEFLKFSDNDKEAIKELLQKPENFKIAQAYLAEFITLNVSRDLKGFNPRIGNSNKRYDDLINEIENDK